MSGSIPYGPLIPVKGLSRIRLDCHLEGLPSAASWAVERAAHALAAAAQHVRGEHDGADFVARLEQAGREAGARLIASG